MTAVKAKFGLIVAVSVLLLACGSLSFLDNFAAESAEGNQVPATRLAVLQENQRLVTEAYAKTLALPGYRLERRHTVA
ncbi:MAG: hypothetical protein R3264_12565, partial [Anaerolineae bacterium]|nr:hypothetical protein [Anaerolineae bacterium]